LAAEHELVPVRPWSELIERSRARGRQLRRRRRLAASAPIVGLVLASLIAAVVAFSGNRAERVRTIHPPRPPVVHPTPGGDGTGPQIPGALLTPQNSPSSATGTRSPARPRASGAPAPVEGLLPTIPPGLLASDRIVFGAQTASDLGSIYVVRGDGSGLTRLTNDPLTIDTEPSWSPDGRRILFTSNRDHLTQKPARSITDVYVVNADGSGVRRISFAPPAGGHGGSGASWSPDGRRIAFGMDDVRDVGQITVVDADGSHLVNLTQRNGYEGAFPSWSPDGRRLVFTSGHGGRDATYVMNADGSHVKQLSGSPHGQNFSDTYPTWSPDGRRIAFKRYIDGDTWSRVWVMDASSKHQRQAVPGPLESQGPAWTPDSRHLLFTRAPNGRLNVQTDSDITRSNGGPQPSEIYIVGLDGRGLRKVISPPPGTDATSPDVAPRR